MQEEIGRFTPTTKWILKPELPCKRWELEKTLGWRKDQNQAKRGFQVTHSIFWWAIPSQERFGQRDRGEQALLTPKAAVSSSEDEPLHHQGQQEAWQTNKTQNWSPLQESRALFPLLQLPPQQLCMSQPLFAKPRKKIRGHSAPPGTSGHLWILRNQKKNVVATANKLLGEGRF